MSLAQRTDVLAGRAASSRTDRAFLAVLLGVTVAAYAPAISGGPLWDDDLYLWRNPMMRDLAGLSSIWFAPASSPQYYPLMFASFWIEYHLWGAQTVGYHVVNVLLHCANVVLFWQVLRAIEVPGALLAAALFALHPIQVETVAWIAERKNLLSTLFALITTLLWLRFRETRAWATYVLVMAAFAAAMLSKTVACTLPMGLLLLAWWQRPREWRREIPLISPMVALAAALGILTLWREQLDGAAASGLSSAQRLLLAGRAVWFYLATLVCPTGLVPIYPRWSLEPNTAWPWLFPGSVVVLLALLWALRGRLGRGPLAAFLFFVTALAPTLGFVDFQFMRYSYVADHFQYFASAGMFALAGAIMAVELSPSALRVMSGGLLIPLVLLTSRQAGFYQDLPTLWRQTIAHNSRAWYAYYDLGRDASRAGRPDEAIQYFQEALRWRPNYAEANLSLGVEWDRRGELDRALEYFIAAARADPTYAEAQYNIGSALARRGNRDEAVAHLLEALRLDPNHAEAHYNLGTLLLAAGQRDEAVAHLRAALHAKPDLAQAHVNLGVALLQSGQADEALTHLAEAASLDPNNAEIHNKWGAVLAVQGRRAEAEGEFLRALAIRPDLSSAQANLRRLRAEP